MEKIKKLKKIKIIIMIIKRMGMYSAQRKKRTVEGFSSVLICFQAEERVPG